jgi:hypothetical protein
MLRRENDADRIDAPRTIEIDRWIYRPVNVERYTFYMVPSSGPGGNLPTHPRALNRKDRFPK